jgi:hypothetical protein
LPAAKQLALKTVMQAVQGSSSIRIRKQKRWQDAAVAHHQQAYLSMHQHQQGVWPLTSGQPTAATLMSCVQQHPATSDTLRSGQHHLQLQHVNTAAAAAQTTLSLLSCSPQQATASQAMP